MSKRLIVWQSAGSKRVIITGSRDWDDEDKIESVIDMFVDLFGDELVIVHGACPEGADIIAKTICERKGITMDPHPAEWGKHGRAAGPIRNAKMVGLGAELVAAFPEGIAKGTRGCMKLAADADLPVYDFSELTLEEAWATLRPTTT